MNHITFQICGLIILSMLIIIVLSKRMLRSFSDKMFMLMLAAMFLSIVIDMISTIAITGDTVYSQNVYEMGCRMYLSSLAVSICLAFLYIEVDIIGEKRKVYRLFPLCILPTYYGICFIFLAPVRYRLVEGNLFFEDTASWIAYGICVYYILMILFLMYYKKSGMRSELRKSARMAVVLFLLMIIMEVMNLFVRVASLSFSLIAVYIYMNMKNAVEHIDKSTGIFNQDAFEYYLKDLVEDEKSAYVLYIGFDDFKTINTTFGFENGRELFKNVAASLSSVYEGKVFLIDAYEIACVFTGGENEYKNYRSIIRYKIREDFTVLDAHIKVPSYVLEIPVQAKHYDYAELFSVMKKYMEELVDSGQSYMLIEEEHFSQLRRQNHVRHVIEQAISEGNIQMCYQPIYNMKTGTFDSAEALIRLHDENGQVIPSSMVISIADDTGLVLQLGELIFKKIFSFVREHNLLGTYLEKMHINLSGVQCASEGMAAELLAGMEEYQIAPAYIDLEIRERAEQLKDAVMMKNMESVIGFGSTFSLDDYGKGYANLESIMEWPIRHVKLDRDLVHMDAENEKAEHALFFVLKMAKQLGMKVVAKGVENETEYLHMKKLNVDYIQGFYLARVLDEKDFLDFIEKPLIINKL
ncbi:MAG: EAL domain-containing protein [Lachnospiraceae bacterium]|nr:EAL domain-containing protein [Lachnospiraceae bacterium]